RAADPAAVWCDVLLAVEGPRPPRVAGPADVARPTMPDDTLDDSLRVDQRAKRTVGRLARGDVPRAHRRNCRFRKVSASFRRAPIREAARLSRRPRRNEECVLDGC